MAKKKQLEDKSKELRELQSKKLILGFKSIYLTEEVQKKIKSKKIEKIERTFESLAKIESLAKGEKTKNIATDDYLKENYRSLTKEEQKLYHFFTITCSSQEARDQLMEEFKKDNSVESVSIDPIAETNMTPNDKLYPKLWGIQRINPEKVWDCTQGCDVVVAIVDTGIDYNHKDLNHNMWEIYPGIHGWNFSGFGAASNVMDVHGHGTHVAGTVAAEGNNNYGVIGVAPKARLMGMKGLNDFGSGFITDLANCIFVAAAWGAKVINNSWGFSRRYPSVIPALDAVINYAKTQGAIVVFAAGNSNDDAQYYYPQNSPNTLTVGATDQADNRPSFSNYGAKVNVSAPGVSILSTTPGDSFSTFSGTSMAAPHVSGMAALILSKLPGLNPDIVQGIIESYVKTITPDKPIGSGRIDLKTLEKLLCRCKPSVCDINKLLCERALLKQSAKKYKKISSKATLSSQACKQMEKGCRSFDFPELKPCFNFQWGDHATDKIESHDTEKVFITVCNPFNNISFKGLTITKITILPNQTLPNGDDAIEITPSKLICYDTLSPCSCATKEYVLMTHYALSGKYRLHFEYCIDEILVETRKHRKDSFDIGILPS